jgi:hypothetical protein
MSILSANTSVEQSKKAEGGKKKEDSVFEP